MKRRHILALLAANVLAVACRARRKPGPPAPTIPPAPGPVFTPDAPPATPLGLVVWRPTAAALETCRAMGVTRIRVPLEVDGYVRDLKDFRWRYNELVPAALAEGFSVLVTPVTPGADWAVARYADELAACAMRVPGLAWEVPSNEPVHGHPDWDGALYGRLRPHEATPWQIGLVVGDVARRVAGVILDADPTARIVVGSVPGDHGPFLAGVLANYPDAPALSIHSYPHAHSPTEHAGAVAGVRPAGVPLFLTEVGCGPGTSEEKQLEYVRGVCASADASRAYAAVYFIGLDGGPSPLTRADGALTPAGEWIQQRNQGG